MTTVIVLTQSIGYVAAALLSTSFLLAWQGIVVGDARKKAGIPYPQAYAEAAIASASLEAKKFNCAQRAHQNTLENLPIILITTLLTSVKHPVAATAGCGIWVVSRVVYTLGYATGEPSKRSRGAFGYIGILGLLTGSLYTTYELIRGSL